MKTIIGVILIAAGIALGLYVGIWECFIGGIVDVITQIRAPVMNVTVIAIGAAKIFFAGFIGWISALVLVIPGAAILTKDD